MNDTGSHCDYDDELAGTAGSAQSNSVKGIRVGTAFVGMEERRHPQNPFDTKQEPGLIDHLPEHDRVVFPLHARKCVRYTSGDIGPRFLAKTPFLVVLKVAHTLRYSLLEVHESQVRQEGSNVVSSY